MSKQERAAGPREQELQVILSHSFGSSAGPAGIVNPCAISPAP